MSDDFEGIPTDAAADVPAEIQADGAVTEDNTGEQVADKAGNAGWFNSNYPGDITKSAANPTQDAYGLNILSAAETKELTRNINPAFVNNLVDPNAGSKGVFVSKDGIAFDLETGISLPVVNGQQVIPPTVLAGLDPAARDRITQFNQTPTISATAVNTGATVPPTQLAVNTSASAVNPGQSNLAGPPDTFIKDAAGNWVENPKYAVNTSATPVNTGATASATTSAVNTSATPVYTPSPYTETRQTAVDAARLNAQSEIPNPYLTNIEKAGTEITKGEAGIATATQTIQSAQQKISTSESIIAQNNAELANPDISPARKAELEANNAAQVQNIFDQTQSVTENQAYITNTQETIDANNVVINDNAAAYRDTTNPAVTTTVPITVDPNAKETAAAAVVNPTTTAAPVKAVGTPYDDEGNLNPGWTLDENRNPVYIGGGFVEQSTQAQAAADRTAALRAQAQRQAVLAAQKKMANDQDWRVRLSLAPSGGYLYNDPNNSILQPLAVTGGVIFPYMPKIEMSYKADYESYMLTHSNYKGYFYKNSYVDAVTAQDTKEAQYLLAVIHFFRSVTKMFYGQDKNPLAGAPPPLVFLTGLGQYQFATQPCLVTAFNYNLPNDVDYIRAGSPNINGTNMLTRRDRQDLPTNPISGAVARLQQLWSSQGIMPGADRQPPLVPSLSQNQPTYVPTKLEMSITLLPVQTRNQISKQFSLRGYASGALLGGGYNSARGGSLKGGFW
jgi:hypothetical protein